MLTQSEKILKKFEIYKYNILLENGWNNLKFVTDISYQFLQSLKFSGLAVILEVVTK